MSTIPTPIETVILLAFLATLAFHDLATSRIPNLLTVPFALIALGFNTAHDGLLGLSLSVGGALLALPMLAPMYLTGGIGAGDVKAISAVGAMLGPFGIFWATIWTLLLGGIGGLMLLISRRGSNCMRGLLLRSRTHSSIPCASGQPTSLPAAAADAVSLRFPYGLAIAFGTAASLLWR